MSPFELTIALLALLLTPGPSNTLMLLSGADRGFRGALPLVPVELAAYLAVVAPLTILAQSAAPQIAALRPAIALVAGLWVLALAVRLWSPAAQGSDAPAVSAKALFVTTLLNPKTLIFGLVLLPGAPLAQGLALFSSLVVIVASVWAAFGWLLHKRPPIGGTLMLRRAAACWLAVLSVGLVANGFSS